MRTRFVCENYTWASARFRAIWPAKYMTGASVQLWSDGLNGEEADAYVFVKAGQPQVFDGLRKMGKQVWWDLCDPVYWFSPQDAAELAGLVTGIVTSSETLATDCREWLTDTLLGTPVHCIPDRLDMASYPRKRIHQDVSPVRFVWFGASQNRIALFGGLVNLERLAANGHDISLTIIDDHPEQPWNITELFPVYYVRWGEPQENELLAAFDIAYLPPYPGPWGRVKSNNKFLTAWANGLPVYDGQSYTCGEMLMRAKNRELTAINSIGCVQQSATEWERLLG